MAALLAVNLSMAAAPLSLIVDTDAGSDDLMAIAFLLSRPDVHIEALTAVNGLAHVRTGATNLMRLLGLSGHPEIPVYVGSEIPLGPTAPFPAEWRRVADELPGVVLPRAKRAPEAQPAAEFLARRLADGAHPVSVLALGPLTNLARAFQRAPAAARRIQRLIIMGGAIRVPGNLGDGGLFKTSNKTAEWNIFVDPPAARIVFQSGAKIELVPLDATAQVPIDARFLAEVHQSARSKLGQFIAQVLESDKASIEGGYFQAWDPLAAVAVVQPGVVTLTPLAIRIQANGRTAETQGRANAQVALHASPVEFRKTFMDAFR
jgi:pyrimidine-specific ribonucleoside hydrolase